ncbi:MAG: DUF4884 domain-containing protein [Bacteroides sp.]|nr:DUF4884 domain-containing protein [Bacteroides sp.]
MKKTVAILLVGTVLFLFSSCSPQIPLARGQADNNRTYQVQYLFEHDGCKVYRFYDMGNYVYFTNCSDHTTAISNDSVATYVQTFGSRNTHPQ